jgi:hypothetical protein
MRFSLLVAFCCFRSLLCAADPVIGTWKLNVAKSTYTPGPAPASQTRVYEEHPGGIQVTIRTVHADGQSTSVQHPLNYDGKEHPVTGSGQADAIALEKIDEYTSEANLKHAGKVIGSNRRVVSNDGKMMTITYQGTDARGRPVKNTAVYDKQ